jgi:hypothetical protein
MKRVGSILPFLLHRDCPPALADPVSYAVCLDWTRPRAWIGSAMILPDNLIKVRARLGSVVPKALRKQGWDMVVAVQELARALGDPGQTSCLGQSFFDSTG